MKTSSINFSPSASLFGDSHAEDVFYYLCVILAVYYDDEFREIPLEEAIEKVHLLWPAYSRMIEFNIRKYYKLVSPSVRSAYAAAEVSSDVRKVLFYDDDYELVKWATDQVSDLDPEQIGTYAEILEPVGASVGVYRPGRRVIFRASRYGTDARTVKWEWIFTRIKEL